MKTIVPVVFLLTLSTAAAAQTNPDWHAQFPAFKIAGNLYYVGSADLASYLITDPQGHILINSSLEESVSLIRDSIEKLGFKMTIHIGTLMAAFERIRDAMTELKTTGQISGAGTGAFRDFVKLMGTDELDALGKKYER